MDKNLKDVYTIWDTYKANIIELAEHHKKTCKDEGCSVSLALLKEMSESVGLEFTDEESLIFI